MQYRIALTYHVCCGNTRWWTQALIIYSRCQNSHCIVQNIHLPLQFFFLFFLWDPIALYTSFISHQKSHCTVQIIHLSLGRSLYFTVQSYVNGELTALNRLYISFQTNHCTVQFIPLSIGELTALYRSCIFLQRSLCCVDHSAVTRKLTTRTFHSSITREPISLYSSLLCHQWASGAVPVIHLSLQSSVIYTVYVSNLLLDSSVHYVSK